MLTFQEKSLGLIIMLPLAFLAVSCSSNNLDDEDLDISEIKKIEATGEFSEDEFFSDEQLLSEDGTTGEEGDLIDVDAELEETGGGDEDLEITGDEFDLDVIEGEDEDLLAEAELEDGEEFSEFDEFEADEEGSSKLAEDDGGFEVFEEKTADTTSEFDVADGGSDDLLLEDGGDLDSFDTGIEDPGPADNNVTIAQDDIDSVLEDDFGPDQTIADTTVSSDVTDENVTISNDFSDGAEDTDQPASELLGSTDIDLDDGGYTEDTTVATDNSSTSSFSGSTGTTTKSWLPVRKMKTVPFVRNGILANSIYFVRTGDSLASIASKIYGPGSGVDFRIANPHLKRGRLKVGQKVYYNSPRRPQDRTRLITFYEDIGAPTQYYQASRGENIRTIASNLLGHPRSWLEVWASNMDVSSKYGLERSFRIRYWNGVSSPSPTLARNTPTTPRPRTNPQPRRVTPPPQQQPKVAVNTNPDPEPIEEPDFNEGLEDETPTKVAQGSVDTVRELEDFNEPDMGSDEPSQPVANAGINEPAVTPTPTSPTPVDEPALNPERPREIAKNPPFPAKRANGILSPQNIQTLMLGAGGLLLLIALILVIRKRRKSPEAIQMDSFDFGGETTIDDYQTKTQIDI